MISARDFIKIQYEPLKDSPALKANFRVGDTVKVHQMIKEITTTKKNISKTAKKALEKSGGGEKGPVERIQVFEGIVIARKHGTEPGGSFIVRKIAAGGVAVEKIYPLYSPTLKKIEIVSRPKVRRAKLYFLRSRTGQAARRLGLGVAVETEVDSSELKKEETPVKTK